jgi:hypothetical protein
MNEIPKYRISIDDEYSQGEDLGIDLISYTATPAIKIKGHAFNSQELPKYSTFKDGKKYRIAGPAIIPGDIYRNDEDGEYFVEFTEKEIEKMVLKFMKKLGSSKNKIFNVEHTDEMAPSYILEAWLVTDPEKDKSFYEYGIKVPRGTFFVVSQFTDKDYYELIVAQDKVGYSIEGFLGLSLSEQFAETFNDYPQAATENAKIALRWAEENGWGDCGTPVGKARANQLASREAISRDTIARMAAFERHRQNSDKELGDGCGRLMWLSWGGDEGVEWAQRKLEQINNKNKTEMKKEELMLPEGAKFQIMDKWYEVKDGKVVEVVEAEKEVAAAEVTETVEEEVEMSAEVSVEEEVEMAEEVKEEVKEEELEEVIEIDYQAKFDEVYEMIATLKAEIAELRGETKVEVEMEDKDEKVELSSKLSKFFSSFKN